MTDDQISKSIAQLRDQVRMTEGWNKYLGEGNGLPKNDLQRLSLMISNMLSVDQFKQYIAELEAEGN